MARLRSILEWTVARPWINRALQTFAISFLILNGAANIWLDQPYLLAFNTFCLGFLTFNVLLHVRVNGMIHQLRGMMHEAQVSTDLANAAAKHLQDALNAGRIEVIPMGMAPDDDNKPILH